MATGANGAVAPAPSPVQLISATEYAHDNLNSTSLSCPYDRRACRKGAPAGTRPRMPTRVVAKANWSLPVG
jgi:hypothetical protein